MYDSYVPIIRLAGGVPKFLRLEPPHWRLPEDAIRAAITPKTRYVILNNPLNPAAVVYPREDLEMLGRICQEFDLIAICDEVWEHVVFDGRLAPYADGATPSPVNAYGRAKAAAEAAVAAAHPGAAIVRTSLIYGLAEIDRSTAGFAARLAHGGRLTLWTDVIRQPVEAGHLADALVALALDLPAVAGTVNVAGTQAISRHAFGRRMLAFWGVGGLDRIEAGRAAELPDGGVPLDLRLDLTRARGLFPTLLSGVDDHVPA
ncbi:MAG: aminotransferase class I/II-fold pyridoxal phosphate-dependent enzyme [Chloroflexi bacterium CFX6]|nr:aminotransferase class I/II-fold pyridoxal phosphate-dependent enzyme [Chloroflexi bacterium CFX6]